METLYSLSPGTLWRYFRSESFAFKAICFYLFLEYVRPQTAYPVLDIIPWSRLTIIATCLALFADKNRQYVSNRADKFVLAFLLIAFLSSMFAYSPKTSWESFVYIGSWVIVYFLITNIVRTEERWFVFFVLFLLVNVKMSLFGFRAWVGRGFAFRGWGVGGAPGWFQNSGEFGIEMCMFLPLVVCTYRGVRDRLSQGKRLLLLFLAVTALGSIIATSSRGAILGIIAVLFWMVLRSRRKFVSLTILCFVVAVGFYFMPAEFLARFDSAGKDSTSTSRLEYWADGIDMMLKYPFLGIGFKNWVVYYGDFFPHKTHMGKIEVCHNTFLEAGAELGWSGLIAYLMLILCCFRNNAETRRIASATGNQLFFHVADGFDGAMVGYLVTSFFIAALYYPFIWITLAFTAALNHVARGVVQVESGAECRDGRRPSTVGAAKLGRYEDERVGIP